MNLVVGLFTAILFFVLSPGILLRLPSNGSKFTVAAVHAVVFAILFHFTHKMVWRMSIYMGGKEGLTVGNTVVDPISMPNENN
jgi:hypothetical protein